MAVSNPDEGIRIRFKEFIKDNFKNNTEAAEILGINSRIYLQKMFSGLLNIPADVLVILHNKYDLNFNWLYTGSGEPKRSKKEKGSVQDQLDTLNAKVQLMEARVESTLENTKKVLEKVISKA